MHVGSAVAVVVALVVFTASPVFAKPKPPKQDSKGCSAYFKGSPNKHHSPPYVALEDRACGGNRESCECDSDADTEPVSECVAKHCSAYGRSLNEAPSRWYATLSTFGVAGLLLPALALPPVRRRRDRP
jgi:hypothetical protein